jgi:hypothetical protein
MITITGWKAEDTTPARIDPAQFDPAARDDCHHRAAPGRLAASQLTDLLEQAKRLHSLSSLLYEPPVT